MHIKWRVLAVPFLVFALSGCEESDRQQISEQQETVPLPELDIAKNRYLYRFAFDCIDQEYPNKLNQVLGDSSYLKSPSELHPAFYGCFDWHSSVHGHWTLVSLLQRFPEFEQADAIVAKLRANINADTIRREIQYFDDPHNKNYERTYGWAWLFKLAEALHQWQHPASRQMQADLQPLVELLEHKLITFLPKLTYPIRVGEHTNTAFALSFALDYARSLDRDELEQIIIARAETYYGGDRACPMTWEPSGFDFLSPCLQEASLMQKVLDRRAFVDWINAFMPGLLTDPATLMSPATVSDRSDGKLAHLDGLNFSRAWCLFEIGRGVGNPKLLKLAVDHFNTSYSKMDSGEYAGAHWLASFALYAVLKAQDNEPH